MPKYITRSEKDKWVLARIRRQNQPYQEYFTLAQHGTWAKAEAEAKKWVKAILPTLPDPIPIKDRKTKRNRTGVVGVTLKDSTRTKKNGSVYPDWRWIGNWQGCPQSSGVGWSVNCYGDERAFVCAYLARKAESVDREAIEKEYFRIQGTAKLKEILALKKLSPP